MTDRYHFRPADHSVPAALLRPVQQLLSSQRPCYLWQAERFDWVVGVMAWQREPRSRHTATMALNVDLSCRGQGVGRFLLEHGLAAAKESGLRTVLVRVAQDQRIALHLFRQFGFQPLLEASKDAGREHALWLGKTLSDVAREGLDPHVINRAA